MRHCPKYCHSTSLCVHVCGLDKLFNQDEGFLDSIELLLRVLLLFTRSMLDVSFLTDVKVVKGFKAQPGMEAFLA